MKFSIPYTQHVHLKILVNSKSIMILRQQNAILNQNFVCSLTEVRSLAPTQFTTLRVFISRSNDPPFCYCDVMRWFRVRVYNECKKKTVEKRRKDKSRGRSGVKKVICHRSKKSQSPRNEMKARR